MHIDDIDFHVGVSLLYFLYARYCFLSFLSLYARTPLCMLDDPSSVGVGMENCGDLFFFFFFFKFVFFFLLYDNSRVF